MPYGPVVKPANPFHPDSDAQKLYEAIHVTKSNEGIASILCFRTNGQRQEIVKRYKEMFGKHLVDEWITFNADFRELLTALVQHPVEYDARQLHRALKAKRGLALMEILFTRSPDHLNDVKGLYKELYHKEIEDELEEETKLHDRLFIKFLINCKRHEGEDVDLIEAEKDAQSLCHPDEEKQHIASGKLYEMLATKSFAHLRSVFDRYEQLGGESVEQLIECDFPGDDEGFCLKAAVDAIRHPALFFATELSRYYDEEGNEISNGDITRIIVSRSEVDLGNILEEYLETFDKPFENVCKKLGGVYARALYALVTQIPLDAPETLRFPLTSR